MMVEENGAVKGIAEARRRRRVLFGPLLLRWRLGGGMSRADAAAMMPETDARRVSAAERGLGGLGLDEVLGLLDGFGYRGPERAVLETVARGPGLDWWQEYPAVMTGAFAGLAVLELAASRISLWARSGVPGLLRAPALTRARAGDAGDADTRPALAAARQRAVLDRPSPPGVCAVLGGVPERAARQVRHPAGRPADVRVLQDGTEFSGGTPFEVLEFGSGPWERVVFVPGPAGHGGFLITDPGETAVFGDVFTALRAASVPAPAPDDAGTAGVLPPAGTEASP
jgi:hypothetical protein